jgi:hypothetical protein
MKNYTTKNNGNKMSEMNSKTPNAVANKMVAESVLWEIAKNVDGYIDKYSCPDESAVNTLTTPLMCEQKKSSFSGKCTQT